MGFCLFNNVAIAARYLQRKHKVDKVAIIDWDVHHGNGTQDTFYEDGSVFFFSTHQWPWYPWTGSAEETGEGKGKGTTLNVPLPAGSGDYELIGAFENKFLPKADKFKPDFVLISAGFDVVDLGAAVPDGKFVEAVREHQPQLVGLGTYMTSTFMHTRETVRALTDAGLRDNVKIICGGPAVDVEVARRMGADDASDNAWDAVERMKRLVEDFRKA